MKYRVPEELEFFERGFGLSDEHDAEEGVFSFVYEYESGKALIFTHSPFNSNSVSAKLVENAETLCYIHEEGVTDIAFQTWGNEKIIRIYFNSSGNKDFRITYNPFPKLYYAEL